MSSNGECSVWLELVTCKFCQRICLFSSLRKEEVQALSGPNEFLEFYQRLKAIRDFHRKHPNEVQFLSEIQSSPQNSKLNNETYCTSRITFHGAKYRCHSAIPHDTESVEMHLCKTAVFSLVICFMERVGLVGILVCSSITFQSCSMLVVVGFEWRYDVMVSLRFCLQKRAAISPKMRLAFRDSIKLPVFKKIFSLFIHRSACQCRWNSKRSRRFENRKAMKAVSDICSLTTRRHHYRNPLAVLNCQFVKFFAFLKHDADGITQIVMRIVSDMVEFSDEEGYGKYLDLHECFIKYTNLKGIEVSHLPNSFT